MYNQKRAFAAVLMLGSTVMAMDHETRYAMCDMGEDSTNAFNYSGILLFS